MGVWTTNKLKSESKAFKLLFFDKNKMKTRTFFAIAVIILALTFLISSASAVPNPGHAAEEIGAGTFDAGDYVFPNNVSVTGNITSDWGLMKINWSRIMNIPSEYLSQWYNHTQTAYDLWNSAWSSTYNSSYLNKAGDTMSGNLNMGGKNMTNINYLNPDAGDLRIGGNVNMTSVNPTFRMIDSNGEIFQINVTNDVGTVITASTGAIYFGSNTLATTGNLFAGGLVDTDTSPFFEPCSTGQYSSDISNAGTLTCSAPSGTNDAHTHNAANITAGTFGSGDFVFPANLNLSGKLVSSGDIESRGTGGYGLTVRNATGSLKSLISQAASNYGWVELYNATNTATVRLYAAGDSYLLGGKLGIGTATPSQALTVAGTIAGSIDATNITSGTLAFARLPTLTNTHTHGAANTTFVGGRQYRNVAYQLANGGGQIIFDTENYDVGYGNNNFANSNFTTPIAGYYTCHACLYLAACADQMMLCATITDMTGAWIGLATQCLRDSGAGSFQVCTSTTYYLAASRKIGLQYWTNCGAQNTASGPDTVFMDCSLMGT
jgi:cytoskeletal protein CcmA (bactofilin family)